ncbi:MAG TPA: hypothetical protein VN668_09950 [Stellaceae bacterium]|nr:hypothetical protein [Stellaceae bacterium]
MSEPSFNGIYNLAGVAASYVAWKAFNWRPRWQQALYTFAAALIVVGAVAFVCIYMQQQSSPALH